MKSLLVSKIVLTEKEWNGFDCHTSGIYTFLNPVSYLDALKHKELFCRFNGIFADGSLLVAAIKMLYGSSVARRSFDMTSVAPQMFEHAQKRGKTIYIVASRQEQVEHAVEIFKDRYKGVRIIGYRNGYFDNEIEQLEEAKHIVEVNPDFLIVGMGVVMQEKFLLLVKDCGYQGVGFTCGGFIHQTAKNEIDYYPQWVDKFNVRFLYRMYREPHTRKRYMKTGVLFPIRFLLERFFGNKKE